MRLTMRAMLKLVLSVCGIFLILSFLSSCGGGWNWKPNPYSGENKTLSVVDFAGNHIMCAEPRFERMTCFTEEDIAALKIEIEKVKGELKQVKSACLPLN